MGTLLVVNLAYLPESRLLTTLVTVRLAYWLAQGLISSPDTENNHDS